MSDIFADLDAAGRALLADACLPDGWTFSFATLTGGATANLTVHASGPDGRRITIRREPTANLYGPYSAMLWAGSTVVREIASNALPAFVVAVADMLDGLQTPGGAE